MRRVKRLKRKQRSVATGLLFKVILPILIVVLGYIFFRLNTRYWNGEDKVNVASQSESGDINVKIYDPILEEVTTLVIPGSTEVSVSRNLGTLRLKNVWQLGVNEKIGGALLTETVTKNFLFPVFLWEGSDSSTNVPFGDRILLFIFEKRTKNLQRNEINLGEAQFVKKQKLADGELGYKIVGGISERLTVYFSDGEIASGSPKIYIKDSTGRIGVAENVGKVVEVMGGKISTIEKAQPEDIDCTVAGKLAKKIARVFNCKTVQNKGDSDIEIVLGKSFAERF